MKRISRVLTTEVVVEHEGHRYKRIYIMKRDVDTITWYTQTLMGALLENWYEVLEDEELEELFLSSRK